MWVPLKVVVVALYYLTYVSILDDYITDVNKLGYANEHGLYRGFNVK